MAYTETRREVILNNSLTLASGNSWSSAIQAMADEHTTHKQVRVLLERTAGAAPASDAQVVVGRFSVRESDDTDYGDAPDTVGISVDAADTKQEDYLLSRRESHAYKIVVENQTSQSMDFDVRLQYIEVVAS